jgi:hypothetical protein
VYIRQVDKSKLLYFELDSSSLGNNARVTGRRKLQRQPAAEKLRYERERERREREKKKREREKRERIEREGVCVCVCACVCVCCVCVPRN